MLGKDLGVCLFIKIGRSSSLREGIWLEAKRTGLGKGAWTPQIVPNIHWSALHLRSRRECRLLSSSFCCHTGNHLIIFHREEGKPISTLSYFMDFGPEKKSQSKSS